MPRLDGLEACVVEIKKNMVVNFMFLNSDKTKMVILGLKKQRNLPLDLTLNLNGCTITPNQAVTNLGVTVDPDLSVDAHRRNTEKLI